jgi:hypothetical protein
MEGYWTMTSPKGGERLEIWKNESKYLITGKGVRVKGPDTMLLETISLTARGQDIYYIATVPDQNNAKPISFKMTGYENHVATFENPAHDFPQRIIYQYVPADADVDSDSIYVKVETLAGKGIDYAFRRKKKR